MSMPGPRRTAACALILALGFGCVTADVESIRLADDVDFSTLETFHIVPTVAADGQEYPGIVAAIERDLVERGRTRAEADQADMWIVFRASTQDRRKRRNSGDPDANSYRIVSYVEGTLAIDVFERAAARRVWHGQAAFEDGSRERLQERVDEIVAAILAELPDA
jgi:hypothetical protein